MRVISWKCLVFGRPRARIPNAWRDSYKIKKVDWKDWRENQGMAQTWKWRSKFFLKWDTLVFGSWSEEFQKRTAPCRHDLNKFHIDTPLPNHATYTANREWAFRPILVEALEGYKSSLPPPLPRHHRQWRRRPGQKRVWTAQEALVHVHEKWERNAVLHLTWFRSMLRIMRREDRWPNECKRQNSEDEFLL